VEQRIVPRATTAKAPAVAEALDLTFASGGFRAKSELLYPAQAVPDRIFFQEKSFLANFGPDIPSRILL